MSETKKKKILVVDDDRDALDLYRLLLESRLYEILTASSAAEGAALFESENPDLVILDVMMEEPDSGFKLAMSWGGVKPVILLSSIVGAADSLFELGQLPVSGILEKPVSPEKLLHEVEKRLLPAA